MKNKPHYAITSVDHALRLATMLQMEGSLGVSDAAERLGVARSTAHRLLSMLVYRDFAAQDERRRYVAGPVLSLAAHSQSRTAALRTVAMPHLESLAARVDESCNLEILIGSHIRFIGFAECTQPLRVGNREGMVFPAHQVSGGLVLLADLTDQQIETLYADEKFVDQPGQRPDLNELRADLRRARERQFAINAERSERGVTALGRGIRAPSGRLVAAVSISMPTSRYADSELPRLLGHLYATVRDIEAELIGIPALA